MSDTGVVILSGAVGLLRRRWLQKNVEIKRKAGWAIESADAGTKGKVEIAMVGDMLFAEERKTLVVVDHPEKGDLKLYDEQSEVKNPDVVLLLHVDGTPRGNTKFGKWVAKHKEFHKSFPLPKTWEIDEVATKFFMAEVKRLGKVVSGDLAAALVNRVGADLGILAFEAQKIVILADLDNSEIVTAPHVKAGMAEIAEAAVAPIMKALQKRNEAGLARAMTRFRRNCKDDPTIGVAGLLRKMILGWLCAADLNERGVPAKDAAARMGLNAWYYETKILGHSLNWSRADLIQLVRVLAHGERAVLAGHQQPWLGLVARLLFLCRRGRSVGC